MPNIKVIPPSRAVGELRESYREVKRYMPRVGKLVQVFSLRPDWVRIAGASMVTTLQLGTLPRDEKELLAVFTSEAGNCHY